MAYDKMYTRDSFGMKDRVIGGSRHSIQLKGDCGEVIFCSNKVFGKIMSDPSISFCIVELCAHEDPRTGRCYPSTKWVEAYLPTRF